MHNIEQKPVKWHSVRQRLCCDWRRIKEAVAGDSAEGSAMRIFFPSYVCVLLFRISNYFYCKDQRRLARCFWLLNFYLTGADILPSSEIGDGLYIPHPAGVSISCKAGQNLTVMVQSGIGPVYRNDTSYQGTPVLGDNILLQHHAGVYGAATIGDNVVISPGCVVMGNVDSNVCLIVRPLKIKSFSPESPA